MRNINIQLVLYLSSPDNFGQSYKGDRNEYPLPTTSQSTIPSAYVSISVNDIAVFVGTTIDGILGADIIFWLDNYNPTSVAA